MVHGFDLRYHSKLDGTHYSNPDFFLIVSSDKKEYYLFPIAADLQLAFQEQQIPKRHAIRGSWKIHQTNGEILFSREEVVAMIKGFKVTELPDIAKSAMISEGLNDSIARGKIFSKVNQIGHNYLTKMWKKHIENALASVKASRKPKGFFARLFSSDQGNLQRSAR